MQWSQAMPTPGSPVRVKARFYYHYGIFISEDEVIQFGLPDGPSRPASEVRVLASDVYTFLQGGNLEVGTPDRQERKKLRSVADITTHARSRLGQDGYDLLHNNCEHFMNECLFGEASSPTIQGLRAKLRQRLGKE